MGSENNSKDLDFFYGFAIFFDNDHVSFHLHITLEKLLLLNNLQ